MHRIVNLHAGQPGQSGAFAQSGVPTVTTFADEASTSGLTSDCDGKDAVPSTQAIEPRREPPLLTVIVPVFNEVKSIRKIIERIKAVAYSMQIIVVDDGSTDGTAAELAQLNAPPFVEVLFHAKNRGKGAAIRTALNNAVAPLTIIQDADLEYEPNDYPVLIEPLVSGEADVVYGSRYLQRQQSFSGRKRFDAGVKLLNLAVRMLYGLRITDEATCYKVFPTEVLRAMDLRCERFEFCPEVTAKVCRMGLRLKEVPIQYSPRGIEEGKKIRLKDGLDAIAALWRFRNWNSSCSDRACCSSEIAVSRTCS